MTTGKLLKGFGLSALCAAALFVSGSAMADLKALSGEAREAANKIDTMMGNIEGSVKELENATDKITDKADTAAVGEANRKLDALKASTAKLDGEIDGLRKLAKKMEMEMKKGKK